MKYFVCTYGKDDSFDGARGFFEESARNNWYKIHKLAKHPRAVYEINAGDIVFLSFSQTLVAWGVAVSDVKENENDEWHLMVLVDKWRFKNPENLYAGVSSYGVSWATIIGGAMSTVRMVKAAWAVEKIQCMGMIKDLPALAKLCFELPITDIASWQHAQYNSDSGIVASIPALQRGLVWSPQQNELLWDSLMRQIPIGAIILSPMSIAQSKGIPCTHLILDGQQRCNAIALGFDNDPFASQRGSEKNKSLLWLDLSPDENSLFKTTRKFLFRITTSAHPWGYRITDDTGRSACLDTKTIRDAVCRTTVKGRRPYTSETYPYYANIPMPMGWVIDAFKKSDSVSGFIDGLSKWAEKLPFEDLKVRVTNFCKNNERVVCGIYDGLRRVFNSMVIAMNSPKEIVEESPRSDGQSTIEHLFTRINRQGTRLDGEELVYSTIKSYWPEIEGVVNKCAKGRMVCSRMLSLALRLYFTDNSEEHWSGGIGINRIKNISETERTKVKCFLEKDMEKLLGIVDEWIVYKDGKGLPKVLKTALAQKTPELYLLLLTLAKNNVDIKRPSIIALTLLLYFYDFRIRKSRRDMACKYIIKELYANGFTEKVLQKAVAYSMSGEGNERWLIGVQDLRNVSDALRNSEYKLSAFPVETPWLETLNRFKNNKEFLLFVQAGFLEETFKDYDPARKDLWAEYNRPWDYDHILPQSVVNRWEHDTVDNQTWLWCIGNFAAIPLEENRSKNDREDWQYYDERKGSWPEIFDVEQITSSYKVDNADDGGLSFRSAVCKRFIRLYTMLYEALEPLLKELPIEDREVS